MEKTSSKLGRLFAKGVEKNDVKYSCDFTRVMRGKRTIFFNAFS